MSATKSKKEQAWQELYPFESHYVALSGNRLHYLDEGRGESIVMVHGNPTWSFYYRRLVQEFRQDHRVIVPDHIGCGLSDKPQDYPYTLEQHIDNLESLLEDKLGLKQMALVVHDWGGAIGMGYAVRHPEKIKACIVLNTAAFLMPNCPWRIWICKCPFFGALAIRGMNAFARAALSMATVQCDCMTPAIKAGYLAPYDNWANRIANLRFVQDIPLSPTHGTWKTVKEIQDKLQLLLDKPMLICWGDQDFCFNEHFLKMWMQYFPSATVHRFADAGHYVLEDAHERILPLLQDFLAARQGAPGTEGTGDATR